MSAPMAMTERYAQLMVCPRPGESVCSTCFNFTAGYDRCYACSHLESWLDHMAAVSYSVSGGSLHRALFAYKRWSGLAALRARIELGALLWRFLLQHEPCVAQASGVAAFDLVTTVPSSDPGRDEQHPLRGIVGSDIPTTRARFQRALLRSGMPVAARDFDRHKYRVVERIEGAMILLIDDTWTTGANAQSAAAALKAAGAETVTCLVIGRHVNPGWYENERRLGELAPSFEWASCTTCRQLSGRGQARRCSLPMAPVRLAELKPAISRA